MAEIRDITDYLAKDALSRRKFLQTTGLLAASLAAGPLLEACGGSAGPSGTSTGTYVPPKAKAGAKVQLLQWNSFVKAADDEFKRQAAEFSSLNGCTVTIHQYLDETVSIRYGPHVVGRYRADGQPAQSESRGTARPVETVENQKQVSHRSHRPLEIPKTRDFHFPTAPTAIPIFRIKNRNPPSASRRGSTG